MRYFLKELLSNRLWLKSTGAPVKWEPIGGDEGIYSTDNQAIIDELDYAIHHGTGGVVSLSPEQYDEAKKKSVEPQSPFGLRQDRFSLSGINLPVRAEALAVASSGVPIHGQLPDVPKEQPVAEALKVQTEFVRPTVKRGVFKDKTTDAK